VSATVQHWTDRYGTDEVKRWHFEIWNEPNYPAFWSPEVEANRAQEYFALYSATAQAVKQVNADYQVGGPATAGPAYIDQLIAYSNKNDVPLDFISFHAYGLGGGRGGLDEFGNSFLYLDSNPLSVAAAANSQSQTIAKSAKPSLPVYITEWSTSYSSRDPVHDHYISAPFILEQLKNTESLAGMSYWTFTDVFEEAGVPPRPFHGGFGLLTLQGIKKPAYFAYQFLNRLGEKELANSDEHSWVARDGTGGAQALFWNLSIPPQPRPANQILFRQVREPPDLPPVELTIKGLTPGAYHAAVYRVGFEKNDAYTAYLKMGMPPDLSREQAVELKLIAGGQPDVEHDVNVTSDGKWSTSLPMRQNDVVLVMLEPTTAR
jgi:xylan 1,4-beta-xylosidase